VLTLLHVSSVLIVVTSGRSKGQLDHATCRSSPEVPAMQVKVDADPALEKQGTTSLFYISTRRVVPHSSHSVSFSAAEMGLSDRLRAGHAAKVVGPEGKCDKKNQVRVFVCFTPCR
jgi:hypothetical protein